MSHTMTFDTGHLWDEQCVKETCNRLELPEPKWVTDQRIASDGGKATGWGVKFPGWNKLCVLSTDGQLVFDNWSPYLNDQHPEVVAGRKQIGDDGRWGDIHHLRDFQRVYGEVLNDVQCNLVQEQCRQLGYTFTIDENKDGRIVAYIES